MTVADVSRQFDNNLHSFHLPLDRLVKVLLLNFWE